MPDFAEFQMKLLIDNEDYSLFANRMSLVYGSNLSWNQQEGLALPIAASGQLQYFITDDTPTFGLRAKNCRIEVITPGANNPIVQWEGLALPPTLSTDLIGLDTYTTTFRGAGGDDLSEVLPDIYVEGGTTSFLAEHIEVGYANELEIGIVFEDSITRRELMRKAAQYVTAYVLEDKSGNFLLISPRRVVEGTGTGTVRAVRKDAPYDLEVNDDEFLVESERVGLVRNSIVARVRSAVVDTDPNADTTSETETVGGDSYQIPAKTSRVVKLPLKITGELSFGNVQLSNISISPPGQDDKVSVMLVSVVDKTATVEIFNNMDLIQGIATISFSITADVRRLPPPELVGNLQQTTNAIPNRETVGGDFFSLEPKSRRTVELNMFIEGAQSFGDIRIENFTVTPGPITDFEISIVKVEGKTVTVQMQNNQDIINGTATLSFSLTAEVIRLEPGEEYVVTNVNSQEDYLPRGSELIDWYPPTADIDFINAWIDARRALNFRKNPATYHSWRISMWQETDALTVFVAELEVSDIFVYNGVTSLICQIEIQYNPLEHRPYKVLHTIEIDLSTPEPQWILGTRGTNLELGAPNSERSILGTSTVLLDRNQEPLPTITVVTWKGEAVTWKGEDVTWKN